MFSCSLFFNSLYFFGSSKNTRRGPPLFECWILFCCSCFQKSTLFISVLILFLLFLLLLSSFLLLSFFAISFMLPSVFSSSPSVSSNGSPEPDPVSAVPWLFGSVNSIPSPWTRIKTIWFKSVLSYFVPLVSSYTPWKHQKASEFLLFSGGQQHTSDKKWSNYQWTWKFS